MIPKEFIDRVIENTDLLDLFRTYGVEVKKTGSNFMARCPFHNEKTPSLSISPSKNVYYCFGCGAKGNAVSFLREKEGLNFVESIHKLAERLGLEVPQTQHWQKEEYQQQQHFIQEKKAILECLKRASCFYYQQLKTSPIAIDYCKSRQMVGLTAKKFQIGYAPNSWNALSLVFEDYANNPYLIKAGLVIEKENGKRYDRFRHRLMIPILNQQEEVVAFGARILEEGEPKYLNSPETLVFTKGKELFGWHSAQKSMHEKNCAILCEGYLDVMMLNQYGIHNVLASLGTATTEEHIRKLLRYVQKIIFAFDGDLAGQKAAWRALENALPALSDSKRLFFVFLPENEDPDSFVRHFGKEAFEELCQNAVPFSAFFFQHFENLYDLKTPETRAQFLENAAKPLALLGAPLLQSQLVKEVANKTYFKEEEVWKKIKTYENQNVTNKTSQTYSKKYAHHNSPSKAHNVPHHRAYSENVYEAEYLYNTYFDANLSSSNHAHTLKAPRKTPKNLNAFWRAFLECLIAQPVLIENDNTQLLANWMDENKLENSLDYSFLRLILNNKIKIAQTIKEPQGWMNFVQNTPFEAHFQTLFHHLQNGAGQFNSPDDYFTRWESLLENLSHTLKNQKKFQKK